MEIHSISKPIKKMDSQLGCFIQVFFKIKKNRLRIDFSISEKDMDRINPSNLRYYDIFSEESPLYFFPINEQTVIEDIVMTKEVQNEIASKILEFNRIRIALNKFMK